MKKLVTFRFDSDLLTRARRAADGQNRNLTNFVETVLRQWLNQNDARPMGEDKLQRAADEETYFGK